SRTLQSPLSISLHYTTLFRSPELWWTSTWIHPRHPRGVVTRAPVSSALQHRRKISHAGVASTKSHPQSGCRKLVVQRLRCHRARSEEHTSELQSRFDLVCRLL